MTVRPLRSGCRIGAGAVLAGALLLALAEPAAADAAGPTDYRTDIVAIAPSTDAVAVEMIGGDSFIQLTVADGVEVLVVGYQGEPYLRFDADGAVLQNENSPARWLNDDRYADTELPPNADAEADPDWLQVADNGQFAWHDHRTHWMNPAKPPGVEPGDTVLEAVVPLVVDGADVEVAVRSVLLDPPPVWPIVAGVLSAAAACALAIRLLGARWGTGLVVTVGATVATVFGAWAYRSVPAETGPSTMLWLLPLVALVAVGQPAVIGRRKPQAPTLDLLVGLAGAELALWGWLRRDALTRALIPSDAPAALDRAVIVASMVIGAVAVAVAISRVVQPPTLAPVTPTT